MSAVNVSLRTRAAIVQMATRAGDARLRMMGNSMLPSLREGYVLHIGSPENLRVGDIAVFAAGSRLVAHRIVAIAAQAVVCSGDAQPDLLEYVARESIVGKVAAAYNEHGRRVDTLAAKAVGRLKAQLRPVRAALKIALPQSRPRTYRALAQAMSAWLRGDKELLQSSLHSQPPLRLARLARAHRCGAALCAAAATLPGDEYAEQLQSILNVDRWSALARRASFAAQVREVAGQLRSAGIQPVLLKGAHRAMRSCSDDALFDSVDIDLLVAKTEMDRACEVLSLAGYVSNDYGAAEFYREHHHAPPMHRAGALPVEVHHALERSAVAVPNTLQELKPFLTRIRSGDDAYTVLDGAGTALHLALHCLHRPPLRDLLLLAAQLRRLDDFDRARLRGIIARDEGNSVALNAAIVTAAQIAGVPWPVDERAQRYAEWMHVNRDLPRPLRRRTACIDAWHCAQEARTLRALQAAFSDRTGSMLTRAARALVWLTCAAVTACYVPMMRR